MVKRINIVGISFIVVMMFFSSFVFADTNGVWHNAADIRGGVIGSDEQPMTSFYSFINPVGFNDGISIAGFNSCSKVYTNSSGSVLCGSENQSLSNVLSINNDAGGQTITNIASPVNSGDVATKAYVDALSSSGGGSSISSTSWGFNGEFSAVIPVCLNSYDSANPYGRAYSTYYLPVGENSLAIFFEKPSTISGGYYTSTSSYDVRIINKDEFFSNHWFGGTWGSSQLLSAYTVNGSIMGVITHNPSTSNCWLNNMAYDLFIINREGKTFEIKDNDVYYDGCTTSYTKQFPVIVGGKNSFFVKIYSDMANFNWYEYNVDGVLINSFGATEPSEVTLLSGKYLTLDRSRAISFSQDVSNYYVSKLDMQTLLSQTSTIPKAYGTLNSNLNSRRTIVLDDGSYLIPISNFGTKSSYLYYDSGFNFINEVKFELPYTKGVYANLDVNIVGYLGGTNLIASVQVNSFTSAHNYYIYDFNKASFTAKNIGNSVKLTIPFENLVPNFVSKQDGTSILVGYDTSVIFTTYVCENYYVSDIK